MIRLSKAPGFDKEDAGIVAAILEEMDTSDPEARKAMIVRSKDIYDRNFHEMKRTRNRKPCKDNGNSHKGKRRGGIHNHRQ